MQLINYAMQRLLAFAFIIFMICVSNRVVNAQTLENELYDQNLEEDTETTEELSTEALEVSVEDSVVHTTDELFEEDFVIEPEIDSEETPAEIVEPSSEPDSSEEILIEELPAEPAEPLDQPIEQEYVETDLEQEVIDTDLELTKEEPNYEIRPIGNNLYFVNTETGEVRKDNAWIDYKGYHIFPNKEGILYRNQFITFGPAYKHYMDSEGKAARGLKQVGNNLYYFDESTDEPLKRGVMRKDNKWVKPNGSTESVFVNDKGLVYRNQWITFGSEEAYYMGNDGYKVKGRVIARGNNLHFTDPITGNVRKDNSWIDYGEHRIFPNKEGILYRNQFITFGPDVAYYMNNSGFAHKGFLEINNKLYYFNVNTAQLMRDAFVVDLSTWQDPNKMNFDLIAEQISGAILRIGTSNRESGIGYLKDNNFERFYSEFTSRNIPVGAYWYSIATSREQGIGEANEVLKHIRGKKFELPIYWDTENQKFQAPATAEKLTDAALGFLSTLKNNGYYAGIYGSTWWLENKLLMNRLSAYQVWVARWNAQTPEYSGDYGMWQFTSRGSLAGYNGDLDLSIIFKDYPQIIKNGGYNGY